MSTEATRARMAFAARLLLFAATIFMIYEATITHPVEVSVNHGDKLLHALAFFALAFLSDFAFPARGHVTRDLFLLMLFGVFIEVVQSFLPWRSADFLDFLADCFGIAAYRFLMPIFHKIPLIRERWVE
ncbi:MAG: VanZ family protein [Chlorobiaceae bacterium]|nr:VanZ family protein [Chlorobiaceae bacterium]